MTHTRLERFPTWSLGRFATVIGTVLLAALLVGCRGGSAQNSPATDGKGGGGTPGGGGAGLALVPPDAAGFMHIRVAKLWNDETAKAIRQQLPEDEMDEMQEDFQRSLGVEPGEVESLTIVLLKFSPHLGIMPFGPRTRMEAPVPEPAVKPAIPDFPKPPPEPKPPEAKPPEFAPPPKPVSPATKPDQLTGQFYFLLPYLEQDDLYRHVAQAPPDFQGRPPRGAEGRGEGRPAEVDDFDAGPAVIVTTTKPCDQAKLRGQLTPRSQEHKHQGKTYYVSQMRGPTNPERGEQLQGETHFVSGFEPALYFADERTFVLAGARDIKRFIDRAASPSTEGPLSQAIAAGSKHDVVIAFNPPQQLAKELSEELPFYFEGFRPLLDVKSLLMTADIGPENHLNLQLTFPDDAKAKEGLNTVKDGLTVLRMIGLTPLVALARDSGAPPAAVQALKQVESAIREAEVKQQGTAVQVAVRVKLDLSAVTATTAEVQERANRRRSANNLKQIGIALHMFHDTYNQFPPAATCSKDGKPLLSWRVMILPFIEQENLYKQFNLNEPWDSEHNKKLLDKMPKLYAPLGVKTKEPHTTFYQVFVGPGTIFEADKRMGLRPFPVAGLDPGQVFAANPRVHIASIMDGTSNTFMVVEAGEPVPWTKPDDLPYDPKKPPPKLGGLFDGNFHALFGDGHVRFFKKTMSEKALHVLIDRRDGEYIDLDEIEGRRPSRRRSSTETRPPEKVPVSPK